MHEYEGKIITMKIIILGAGQVGGTLAENLVGENNEITVIDSDPTILRALQDRLDLQVVTAGFQKASFHKESYFPLYMELYQV